MPNLLALRKSLLPSLLALMVGVVSGCVLDRESVDWENGDSSCSSKNDCQDGQFCMRGQCVASPDTQACQHSHECPYGEVCVNNVCNQPCRHDFECAKGAVCTDHYCRAAPGTGDAGTADAGTPTDGGTRPPPTDGGISDGGTGDGGISDGGTGDGGTGDGGTTCSPPDADAGTGSECVRNTDCPANNYCINNACIRGCSSDSDCNASDMCTSNLCRPRPTISCTGKAQCPTDNDCVDGTCRAICASATTCSTGWNCTIGYCFPGDAKGTGRSCEVDCDCGSGLRCVEAVCQP